LLLDVRNWTSRQWSHRTTSRESTGASVVAIGLWECQSGATPNSLKLCSLNLGTTLGERFRLLGQSAAFALWMSRLKYEITANLAGESGSNRQNNRRKQAKSGIEREAAQCLLIVFARVTHPFAPDTNLGGPRFALFVWALSSDRLLDDDHVHAPGSECQAQRQGLRAHAGAGWRGPGVGPDRIRRCASRRT